jgi:hypothetical protein
VAEIGAGGSGRSTPDSAAVTSAAAASIGVGRLASTAAAAAAAAGSSPAPKSPGKRAAAAGALQCESAAAAVAEDSDVQAGWQSDVSRCTSPAVGVGAELAQLHSGSGVGLKALLGPASEQSSGAMWQPVVDASAEARGGRR